MADNPEAENPEGHETPGVSVGDSPIPPPRKRIVDPEGGYDDPAEGIRAEKAALASQNKINLNALPNKDYLEITIIPAVLKALTEVSEVRPVNPIEFVAYSLLNRPSNS